MATLSYSADDYYFAGLFDGEGSVSVYHRDDYGTGALHTKVILTVSMCVEAPIQGLKTHFGGGTVRQGRLTASGRPVWTWYQVGVPAKPTLEVLKAICRVKRPQIVLALEAIELIERTKHRSRRKRITPEEHIRRGEIAQEIRALKAVS